MESIHSKKTGRSKLIERDFSFGMFIDQKNHIKTSYQRNIAVGVIYNLPITFGVMETDTLYKSSK